MTDKLPADIIRIMKEDGEILKMFEEWDRTGIDPFEEGGCYERRVREKAAEKNRQDDPRPG